MTAAAATAPALVNGNATGAIDAAAEETGAAATSASTCAPAASGAEQ